MKLWDSFHIFQFLQINYWTNLLLPQFKESLRVEEEYDEVTPDTGEILAEDSIETSGVSEEDTDSEDLKQLKARIMAVPVLEEEGTYHPRGRMVMNADPGSPPPVPPHRTPFHDIPPPERALSPTNLTPASSNSAIVPKSILKKRTDPEPVPTNQYSRPAPPEKPIRKSLPVYDDDTLALTSRLGSVISCFFPLASCFSIN